MTEAARRGFQTGIRGGVQSLWDTQFRIEHTSTSAGVNTMLINHSFGPDACIGVREPASFGFSSRASC